MCKIEVNSDIMNKVVKKIGIALNEIDKQELDVTDMKNYLGDMDSIIYNCVPTCFNIFDFYKKDGTQWTKDELATICEKNDYFIS